MFVYTVSSIVVLQYCSAIVVCTATFTVHAGPSLAENVTCSEMDYTLDEENAVAAYYDNEEDYRTFHYLENQMKVKRQHLSAGSEE